MEIILGKSKTGKSKYIYECIKEDIENGLRPILFVPSQTRVIAEENYIKYLNLNGIIGVNITTISEYISNIMKSFNIHFDENYISKLDKKIIMTQVIKENEELFKMFKKVKFNEGFFESLNIYMDIFRKEDIDVEKIEQLELKNKTLENKLKELIKIYEKYVEKINSKYIDNIDEVDILAKKEMFLKEKLSNVTVYFDGYNNFTKSEFKFIKLLLLMKIDVKITLKTDYDLTEDIDKFYSDEIFEVANDTYKTLVKIAKVTNTNLKEKIMYINYSKANKDILYLAENVFSNKKNSLKLENDKNCIVKPEHIYLNVYQNAYKEAQAIAFRICKAIRKNDKYSDFCIYTTDLENYASVFSRVFYEYNIPLYVDKKISIEDTRITKYILILLKMGITGINLDDILEILKLRLNNIDDIDISYFENYVLEFNINKYNINKKFYLNNERYDENIYNIERLNKIREDIINIFSDVSSFIKNEMTAKDIVHLLYTHLVKNDILQKYDKHFENIEDKPYYIYSISIKEQVWEKICEVFDSICKIYEDDKMLLSQFYKIFNLAIKDVRLKAIPPTKDKVMLVDIDVTKVDSKKYGFFVGVIEGSFPKKQDQDIFFNDYELEALKEYDTKFKETTISKENMGLYNIYEALSNTYEKLYISMPSTDISSNSTRKSSFILLIQKVFDIKLLGEVTQNETLSMNYDNIYSKEKAFEYLIYKIKECEEKIDSLEDSKNIDINIINEILGMYKFFEEDEKYSKILGYIKDDSNLSKTSVDRIYKDTLKSSVYKLELFKSCPFSYCMKYILNLSKKKVFDITSMDTGNFMHDVLEKFSMYLFKNNIFWHEIIKDENTLYEKYQIVLFDIISKDLDENFKRQKESVKYTIYKQKLTNTLKKVVVVIARGFNQSEFVPYGYELYFKDNGDLLPIDIKLDNNKNMKIVGKIDRIDTLQVDDKVYARVVDYKSSGKTISVDKIREGISLQLITYLTAFVDSKNKLKDILKNDQENENIEVLPSATLYFDLSNKLLNLNDYTKDDTKIQKEIIKKLRMNGLFLKDVKILEKMDSKVNNTDEKLIDVSPSRASKKCLEQEEFNMLCKEAKEILKNIGNEMLKGNVKIQPSKKSKPCEYCDFSSVCRKNISL